MYLYVIYLFFSSFYQLGLPLLYSHFSYFSFSPSISLSTISFLSFLGPKDMARLLRLLNGINQAGTSLGGLCWGRRRNAIQWRNRCQFSLFSLSFFLAFFWERWGGGGGEIHYLIVSQLKVVVFFPFSCIFRSSLSVYFFFQQRVKKLIFIWSNWVHFLCPCPCWTTWVCLSSLVSSSAIKEKLSTWSIFFFWL